MTVRDETTNTEPEAPTPQQRLDALLAMYDVVKAAAENAEGVYKRLTDGIKNAAIEVWGAQRVANGGVYLHSDKLSSPLNLTQAKGRTTVDSKRLAADYPEVYAAVRKVGQPYWQLGRAK